MPTLTGDVLLKVYKYTYTQQNFMNICFDENSILTHPRSFHVILFLLQVRPGTQPGDKEVLKGKGMYDDVVFYTSLRGLQLYYVRDIWLYYVFIFYY